MTAALRIFDPAAPVDEGKKRYLLGHTVNVNGRELAVGTELRFVRTMERHRPRSLPETVCVVEVLGTDYPPFAIDPEYLIGVEPYEKPFVFVEWIINGHDALFRAIEDDEEITVSAFDVMHNNGMEDLVARIAVRDLAGDFEYHRFAD
jgi:hypothetical protein